MESTRPTRVVPSGKVYRQIFDAEVQLVNALDSKGRSKDKAADRHPVPTRDATNVSTGGMLTQRQRTWVEGYPNEQDIENPVLYKHVTDEARFQQCEPEACVASREVQGLPDVITPAKTGSDIIERIAESRKERHEHAVEEMHQELGVISSAVEPKIEEIGQQLIRRLSENDKLIDTLMGKLEDDQKLLEYSMEQLTSLWDDISVQSIIRQRWISELDTDLTRIENERMEQVKDVFSRYARMLGKIAHLMSPDLQRLLDKESQAINQTVLSNWRAYADLYARLMMSDIEREKRLHTEWKKRVEDWKQLNTQVAVQNFRNFMESEVVQNPENVKDVFTEMREKQATLNKKRLELIEGLRNLKPPASTKTAVYEWNKQIADISKEIDGLNQEFFNKVYGEYEHVLQDCLSQVEQMKAHLVETQVCTEIQANKVASDHCLPLVGDKQTQFEQTLEEMDKMLEEHNRNTEKQLKSLFKYIQGAAHVWDVHEIGLAKQERSLQERLDDCRRQHDSQNQDLESNLDILMDRMRQDATEQALRDSLKKAVEMLVKIKDGYEVFHKNQLEIVNSYPDMVREEIHNYDAAVCKFFGVDRNHPDGVKREERDEEEELPSSRSAASKKTDRKKRTKRPASRSSSQASDASARSKTASPLPLIVSEILNTENGSTFYVLTVAGEHGPPPLDHDGGEEPAFLTEAPDTADSKPAYIENVDITETFLVEIKKQVRLNLLNHMEAWQVSAVERSLSVVAAKSEELNSELDLRLHLHQPRARRAELDVHNVRAAELVMHSERVSRHCKGISQSLNELRHKFNTMTIEHNQLTDKFRSDIEEMEVVFINATKSSRLVSLSNQLQEKLDHYMGIIRQSLRQFRQHLDETLQMLRESNARFIKSFKLFSDGGNFCPEEIDEYRKRLEKMALKIDSSEGFVMADLEGMESKRLDQATKIATEFEDRFRNHMVDLLFMEKIARWLTNTQVKIKAEVADSNSQAQQLAQMLQQLERRIDACEHPNPDKEQITPTQLINSLRQIFDACNKRTVYLNCIKEPKEPSSLGQSGVNLGARVNFTSDAVPPISKPGKQPAEDPSVGVIRNILRTQKTKMRFGIDAELDGEPQPEKSMIKEPSMESKEKGKTSRPTTQQDSKSTKSSRKGTAVNGSNSDGPKRTSSATRRLSKGQKFDKKGLPFGEKEDENEDSYFTGKIKHILRDALDGLIAAADLYYRQKGNRQVTRPQALQETFEQCTEIITQKLWSYYNQADEYHNQCLQELREQLWQLEHLVARVPGCVIQELMRQHIQEAQADRADRDTQFNQQLSKWQRLQGEHKQLLRPSLGHPQKAADLQSLCDMEAARRDECLDGVQAHAKLLQDQSVSQAQKFVESLSKKAEELLLQFDNMLTIDDVKKGRVAPTKYPTSELMRRKNAGLPLYDDENKNSLPRGKKNWPGMPKDELVLESEPGKAGTTGSVTTTKTTLGHSATEEARDQAYQEYAIHFQAMLKSISEQQKRQTDAEQRWTDSWINSVHKVQQLYSAGHQK